MAGAASATRQPLSSPPHASRSRCVRCSTRACSASAVSGGTNATVGPGRSSRCSATCCPLPMVSSLLQQAAASNVGALCPRSALLAASVDRIVKNQAEEELRENYTVLTQERCADAARTFLCALATCCPTPHAPRGSHTVPHGAHTHARASRGAGPLRALRGAERAGVQEHRHPSGVRHKGACLHASADTSM